MFNKVLTYLLTYHIKIKLSMVGREDDGKGTSTVKYLRMEENVKCPFERVNSIKSYVS